MRGQFYFVLGLLGLPKRVWEESLQRSADETGSALVAWREFPVVRPSVWYIRGFERTLFTLFGPVRTSGYSYQPPIKRGRCETDPTAVTRASYIRVDE